MYYKACKGFEWKPPVNKVDGEKYGKTRFAELDVFLASQKMECEFRQA
jgi:hypothetical protein